jgi:hypothetical protein
MPFFKSQHYLFKIGIYAECQIHELFKAGDGGGHGDVSVNHERWLRLSQIADELVLVESHTLKACFGDRCDILRNATLNYLTSMRSNASASGARCLANAAIKIGTSSRYCSKVLSHWLLNTTLAQVSRGATCGSVI